MYMGLRLSAMVSSKSHPLKEYSEDLFFFKLSDAPISITWMEIYNLQRAKEEQMTTPLDRNLAYPPTVYSEIPST
jgi:hypothetical protein